MKEYMGREDATSLDLCLASLFFYPVYSGPAVRFRRYAPGLRARGICMRVFTGTPDYIRDVDGTNGRSVEEGIIAKNGTLLPVEHVGEIPVQRVQIPPGRNKLRKDVVYNAALIDYCRQPAHRPDLIQLLSVSIWSIPWLVRLRSAGIPLVYTHTMLGELSAKAWKRQLQRRYWRLPFQFVDCVVVSSGVMRDGLREIGVTTRTEVIPNGLDLDRFRPVASREARNELRAQLGFDPSAELIVFVGSIDPRKGVDVLAEAWRRLGAGRPNAYLVLVGPRNDELRPWLSDFRAGVAEALETSGARDRVIFTGSVKNVEAYLQAADLFVFPSRREGMPNVVPEAFGCGLPSILTPFIGLPREFGRPDEHYALVDRTPDALATAIVALLDDPARRERLGQNARRWVEQELGIERSLDQYASLYREMVASSKKGEQGA